mgnify:CR=1 FL=1
MKNEPRRRADQIVDLLAESLKKQDQHSELLGKLVDRMNRSEKQQKDYNERTIGSVNALTDIVQKWKKRRK